VLWSPSLSIKNDPEKRSFLARFWTLNFWTELCQMIPYNEILITKKFQVDVTIVIITEGRCHMLLGILWLYKNPIFFYIQGVIYAKLCTCRSAFATVGYIHIRVSLPYANIREGRLYESDSMDTSVSF